MGRTLWSYMLLLFPLANVCAADDVLGVLRLAGEAPLFQFRLEDGSYVVLLEGGSEDHLVLRTGTPDSLLFQYPENPDGTSWDLFLYTFYFRGGGPWNEGLDLNSLTFTAEGVEYTLYEDYYAGDGSLQFGLRIVYPDGATDLRAVESSLQGSLIPFRTAYPVRREY
ncbi:MAG: hypothetical protein JXA64_03525 [Candidatus Fermentibacteraceae bacterium]|nr:hypothetical protein [Candidatus Fermentibacteraceae bacterium]